MSPRILTTTTCTIRTSPLPAWPAIWALLLATLALAIGGCGSLTGGGDDDDDDDLDTGSRPASVDVDVPRDARVVKEGKGTLTYRATDDGTLYAYDDDRRTVVWYGKVREGQEFVLEPGEDRATLDDALVIDQDLKQDNFHVIYLDRSDADTDSSSDVPKDIPSRADLVEDGRDSLSYRATDDGTIYVYDRDDDHLLLKETVRDGDRVELDVEDDEIRINDRVVEDEDLKRDHRHEIYFDRD